jgi:hypothetical protein
MVTQQSHQSADTSDDRHVLAKHATIYPTEQDLAAVQTTVSVCEKALKQISDLFAEMDASKSTEKQTEMEVNNKSMTNGTKTAEKQGGESEAASPEAPPPIPIPHTPAPLPRALKGVVRVGLLAKGLLLHNDLNMELAVLCQDKPTRSLLRRILDALPAQLASVSDDKYLVRLAPSGTSITVMRDVEPRTTCVIVLTSQSGKDETDSAGVNTKDLLDAADSLKSLARLRHTKWFQAKASGVPSCVVVIRVMRDFCERVPTWKPLSQWALELLVERSLATGRHITPGEALRKVFECVSSGILLPGGCGLYDPCEKVPTDAIANMSAQQREDITNSAQHALRMITFGQVHRLLGIERLPSSTQRKRAHVDNKPATSHTAEGGGGASKGAGHQ